MSKDEKAFETLLGPSLQVTNKEGEVILSLKRKGLRYGQLYYLFEIHMDRVDPEKLGKFQVTWEMIKSLAKKLSIPLYKIDEVYAGVQSQLTTLSEQGKPPKIGEPFDIKIDILDHATGLIHKLTFCITATPK